MAVILPLWGVGTENFGIFHFLYRVMTYFTLKKIQMVTITDSPNLTETGT